MFTNKKLLKVIEGQELYWKNEYDNQEIHVNEYEAIRVALDELKIVLDLK